MGGKEINTIGHTEKRLQVYVWKRWFNNGKKNILIGTLRREETRVGIVFLWEKQKRLQVYFWMNVVSVGFNNNDGS